MTPEMGVNGRVIPVHGRVDCAEHGDRVHHSRFTPSTHDRSSAARLPFELGKH